MADVSLMPMAGMNTVAEDAALHQRGEVPRLYLRDAVNMILTPAGKPELRPGVRRVTATRYKNLWQSPLHGDTFATLDGQWVRIGAGWSSEALATIGDGPAFHEVLNNVVCVAGPNGIFTFNGSNAQRLTIDTPAAPLVMTGSGSLEEGRYGVAVSWLRDGLESGLSRVTTVDAQGGGSLEITLPLAADQSITGARLYLTKQNGGELARAGDYAANELPIHIPLLPELGAYAKFQHLSPMPTGKYLGYWRGRIVTASANVLRFSEALAFHLHDERHGFVQMPQRITFVRPVDGGLWVGQMDHVAFLSGTTPADLSVVRKASKAPVPGSAILMDSDAVGAELSGGGGAVAMWLAENGYVIGTNEGATVELQAGVMSGIAGQAGTSVVFERRAITAVM